MTRKADFNAEEWSLVLEGPPIAGLRVVTADRGGMIRESLQMGQAYAEARKQHGSSELLDDIVAERPPVNRDELGSVDDLRVSGMERLREAVELLERKATAEEVEAYKVFVVNLAQRVAAAHKEGGVLGIGGKEISDAERSALAEITSTLGVNPTDSGT